MTSLLRIWKPKQHGERWRGREVLAFNVENLINGVHGEPMLLDLFIDASEEEKEIAWYQIAQSFGMTSGELGLGLSFVVHWLLVYRHMNAFAYRSSTSSI